MRSGEKLSLKLPDGTEDQPTSGQPKMTNVVVETGGVTPPDRELRVVSELKRAIETVLNSDGSRAPASTQRQSELANRVLAEAAANMVTGSGILGEQTTESLRQALSGGAFQGDNELNQREIDRFLSIGSKGKKTRSFWQRRR